MNFLYTLTFLHLLKSETKRLIKKYHSLKNELSELFEELAITPTLGTSLGNDVYKLRLGVKSKGKGKSGGVRIITYVEVSETTVVLGIDFK